MPEDKIQSLDLDIEFFYREFGLDPESVRDILQQAEDKLNEIIEAVNQLKQSYEEE